MQCDCPSLGPCIFIGITLKDLRRDPLFTEALGECETADARSNDEYVHFFKLSCTTVAVA